MLPDADKFNGENWAIWKLTIVTAAKARGVHGYFDGTIIDPASTAVSTTGTQTPAQLAAAITALSTSANQRFEYRSL